MARSVAGIVQREDGHILVARRCPGGDIGGKWEFPGGKVEGKEDDAQALEREFLEELGVQARVGRFLTEAFFYHREKKIELFAYSVQIDSPHFTLVEHSEYDWVPFNNILQLDFVDSDKKLLDGIGKSLKLTMV